jgi:hypothetical protein
VLWIFRDGVLWIKWPTFVEHQNVAQVARFAMWAFGKNVWLCGFWLIVLPFAICILAPFFALQFISSSTPLFQKIIPTIFQAFAISPKNALFLSYKT